MIAGEITRALRATVAGDPGASAALFPLVAPQLRERVRLAVARERRHPLLQPTAIVHDTFLRLLHNRRTHWNDRGHYFRVAARVIRRLLVDFSRSELRHKRGNGVVVEQLTDDAASTLPRADVVLDLHEALTRLAACAPRAARVAELRVFGGHQITEVAAALGVPLRTTEADWAFARAFLHRELER
jgi:RNA polymerase sigma factor (TIGR02999 family)